MPSPAEPHSPVNFSGQIPLTASALDQLDAQFEAADAKPSECRFINPSSSHHSIETKTVNPNVVGDPQPTITLSKMAITNRTTANLERKILTDSSSSPPPPPPPASHDKLSFSPSPSPSYSRTPALISPHHPPKSSTPPLPLLMTDYTVDGTIYRHPETLNTLITIAPTPDKGLAVFALHDLPPHTLLLSERPLVALNDDGARADPLDALVNALPPSLKRAYRSLHGFSASSSASAGAKTPAARSPRETLNRRVLYSNGFAIERTTTAVFEVASRINHSCVPNARFRWDEEAGRMDYYVVRKVLKGEEVCIDYGHTKGRLLKYYGFECACGGCTEWGSVTTSSGGSGDALGEKGEDEVTEVRLVQADGLWRPVEVAEIAAAVEEDKENAMRCVTGGEKDKHGFQSETREV